MTFEVTPQMAQDAAAIASTDRCCQRCGLPGAQVRIVLSRVRTLLVCQSCAFHLGRVYREILAGPAPRAGGRLHVVRGR